MKIYQVFEIVIDWDIYSNLKALTFGVGWHTAVGLKVSEFDSIKRGIVDRFVGNEISLLVCGRIVEFDAIE